MHATIGEKEALRLKSNAIKGRDARLADNGQSMNCVEKPQWKARNSQQITDLKARGVLGEMLGAKRLQDGIRRHCTPFNLNRCHIDVPTAIARLMPGGNTIKVQGNRYANNLRQVPLINVYFDLDPVRFVPTWRIEQHMSTCDEKKPVVPFEKKAAGGSQVLSPDKGEHPCHAIQRLIQSIRYDPWHGAGR